MQDLIKVVALLLVLLGVVFYSLYCKAEGFKINSANRFNGITNSTEAEVCGQLEGPRSSDLELVLIADPGQPYEGEYSIPMTPSGKFCMLVNILSSYRVELYRSGQVVFSVRRSM